MKEFSGSRSVAPSPSPKWGGSGWGSGWSFFFKVFRRNLTRQGLFPLINIAGLAIGLTVVLLICAFIFNEYSFNKSFSNGNRIYRVNSYLTQVMAGRTISISSNALAPAVKDEIPEVEAAVSINVEQVVVKVNNTPFKVEHFCWADEDFFRLFDTPFIYGSLETVFSRPNTIAISESEARILFGDQDPLGETIMLDNKQQMEVTAVYKDFPANSSFGDYQMIGHYKSSYQSWIRELRWSNLSFETYCMLVPGADASAVEDRMQLLIKKGAEGSFFQARLQPLDRIHLYSKDFMYSSYTSAPGDIKRVKMFSLLAVIILLVACINYMNLSTARAQKRSKEIGISKTLGAKRKSIILRLYSETGVLTFLSFVLAFVLAYLLLPAFNNIAGQDIHPGIILNPLFLSGVLSIYIITTFVAASYPALYLSGFAPLTVIRQAVFSKGSSHALVRKGLTIVQFSIAVILIAWVIVIRSQVNYMTNKDIGYNAHNVFGIPVGKLPGISEFEALKNNYLAQESVSAVAFSQSFPFTVSTGNVLFKTMTDMHEAQKSDAFLMNSTMFHASQASPEIIDVFQLKLIAGTTLPEFKKGDSIISIIVNRKAVEYLETTPEEIIGKRIPANFFNESIYVCGVVEDFNDRSLHEPIVPYGFHNSKYNNLQYLLLKVKDGNTSQQLQTYEEIFRKHFPNDLFEAEFPSILLAKIYEEDRQTNRIVLSFSILAILVACMGVFGLTAFMSEQCIKEIGIRKVLGAGIGSIVRLFTDSYLRLLLLSLVIAIPIVWWICSKYLESFAYRISLAWWMFAVAAFITIILTLLTVGALAIKAATANPVKAIKSE